MSDDDQAMDITDLEQAQRIIVALRQQIVNLEESARPAENEFMALLDADHAARLTTARNRRSRNV